MSVNTSLKFLCVQMILNYIKSFSGVREKIGMCIWGWGGKDSSSIEMSLSIALDSFIKELLSEGWLMGDYIIFFAFAMSFLCF